MQNFKLVVDITHDSELRCNIGCDITVSGESDENAEYVTSAALLAFMLERLLADQEQLTNLIDHYTKELQSDVSGQEDSESVTE